MPSPDPIAQLDVVEVYRRLGYRVRSSHSLDCRLHEHDDAKPRQGTIAAVGNKWTAMCCGQFGDSADLLAWIAGFPAAPPDEPAARERLAQLRARVTTSGRTAA